MNLLFGILGDLLLAIASITLMVKAVIWLIF